LTSRHAFGFAEKIGFLPIKLEVKLLNNGAFIFLRRNTSECLPRHEAANFARGEVLSGCLIGDFGELADQLLEDCAHLGIMWDALTTSTLLTLLVLPALYQWIEQRREVSTTSKREN